MARRRPGRRSLPFRSAALPSARPASTDATDADRARNILQPLLAEIVKGKVGLVASKSKQLDAQLLNQPTNSYAATSLGGTRYFGPLASSVESSWDLDSSDPVGDEELQLRCLFGADPHRLQRQCRRRPRALCLGSAGLRRSFRCLVLLPGGAGKQHLSHARQYPDICRRSSRARLSARFI